MLQASYLRGGGQQGAWVRASRLRPFSTHWGSVRLDTGSIGGLEPAVSLTVAHGPWGLPVPGLFPPFTAAAAALLLQEAAAMPMPAMSFKDLGLAACK